MMDMHSSNQYLKESRKEYLKTKLKKEKPKLSSEPPVQNSVTFFKCSTR